jgi:phosphoribosylanthranilate isomerase
MLVKVCGLKSFEEIDWAVELGYSAAGIVLHPESKRFVEMSRAVELAVYAGERITTVAVAKRFDDLKEAAPHFDYIQVYEKINAPDLIYAGGSLPEDLDFKYFLYDVSIGSGEFEEFPSWLRKISDRLILAGGLDAGNVKKVIEKFNPFGVDVSSGVEEDGRKSFDLMKEFIKEVENATS